MRVEAPLTPTLSPLAGRGSAGIVPIEPSRGKGRLTKDMKTLVAIILSIVLALTAAASAASPEQAYLAARDAYIKALSHGEPDPDFEKHKRALADLETQLRKIIGPTTL